MAYVLKTLCFEMLPWRWFWARSVLKRWRGVASAHFRFRNVAVALVLGTFGFETVLRQWFWAFSGSKWCRGISSGHVRFWNNAVVMVLGTLSFETMPWRWFWAYLFLKYHSSAGILNVTISLRAARMVKHSTWLIGTMIIAFSHRDSQRYDLRVGVFRLFLNENWRS